MPTRTPAFVDPVVAVCSDAHAARRVVQRLGDAGFDMAVLSIVGKGRGGAAAGDDDPLSGRVRSWSGLGGLCGAIGGLLLGPALFFVVAPVGLVAVGGPFALTLLTALEGALVGAGATAIVAALTSAGTSDEQARRYEEAVDAEGLLVLVHGSAQDVERARAVLAVVGVPAAAAPA